MGAKRLDIHPAALEELKSAFLWYLERSETPAGNFAAELDTAMDLVVNAAGTLAERRTHDSEICPATISVCHCLP